MIIKNITIAKVIGFALVFVFMPVFARAAMQSQNYVIYDSVMHSFDGPVIFSVTHSVSGQSATVTWNTDIIADGFVEYDTNSGFSASKEQGSSVKDSTGHSVVVGGLEANTLYYYRVKSERVNGGITVDSTTHSFTSGQDQDEQGEQQVVEQVVGGGGILIIDKTDKVPPEITNISVKGIAYDSVEVNWETDEEATSFVEYGSNSAYGSTYGQWDEIEEHSVVLVNLEATTLYHFRVLSSDDWGNISYSEDQAFTTAAGEGKEAIVSPEEIPAEEEGVEPEIIIPETASDALDFITRLFPYVSLNDLNNINSISDLTSFISRPVLSGEPGIEVTATEALVSWSTDIESNSLVALAPDLVYSPQAQEPYQQISGDSEGKTTYHEVRLYGLAPETLYHFQLRSKADLGPTARSRDYTFQTSLEELSITSFFSQILDDQNATFKWVTNKEADTTVKYAPYRGNVLAIDESKTIKENILSAIHEVTIDEFIAGTYYDVEIISIDGQGNVASEVFSKFSTSEDDLPPTVSHIKTDSTIFIDRSNKIQTIISWMTNEPATSKVYYQEGVHGNSVDLAETTALNTNYTKEHVMVITKFKPGVVYSFRAQSIDSGGNTTLSNVHTFMTAKKKESIFQIIIGILENTFGWLKKIM